MTTEIVIWLLVGLTVNAIIAIAYEWAAHSEKYKQYRIRTPEVIRIPRAKRMLNSTLNNFFSFFLYGMFFWLCGDFWIHHQGYGSLATVFGEVLGVLLVYDFIYYWFHRIFHHPKLMKYVHGVHHKMRFPTALDATYLSPVENFAGLGILFIALTIFAPVSVVSFLLIIIVHAFINIIVHANMILPHPLFKLTNYWAAKHDLHHGKHLNKNFSNIFPYWDMMFGTNAEYKGDNHVKA